MSRTDAHEPAHVELEHVTNQSILRTRHQHWVNGHGLVSCLDPRARCEPYVPRWASAQPRTRRGTAVIERRAAVRDTLRVTATTYRAYGHVDDPVIPGPNTYCLCQSCGGVD